MYAFYHHNFPTIKLNVAGMNTNIHTVNVF
jgi:hypothetical protein